MLDDLKAAVKKIGHFLGESAENLVEDPEKLQKIVEESGFGAMKKNEDLFVPNALL